MEKTKGFLRSYTFDGIMFIILGCFMLLWPEIFLNSLCIFLGSFVGFVGLVRLITFFVSERGTRIAADLVSGVLLLGFGIALIAVPSFFIRIYQYITGAVLIYGAILLFIQSYRMRDVKGSRFILSTILGVIIIILAVIIIVNPEAFARNMTQINGISLIIDGISMVLIMRDLKKTVIDDVVYEIKDGD